MKQPYRFFSSYSKGQQKGILALFILILTIQAGYYALYYNNHSQISLDEEQEWLALQAEVDRLKAEKSVNRDTVYPFNPNYLSSYKGYMLGMSITELNRLFNYRGKGMFISGPEDFQKVTGVSDSLFATISPYLRFPDIGNLKRKNSHSSFKNYVVKRKPRMLIDINKATEEDLIKVYGVGSYFSKAIVKRRTKLGAYVSMDQMFDFEDIGSEAIRELNESFAVIDVPHPVAININEASLNQLSHFPYFNKELARAIITRRSMLGKFMKIEDLLEINGFPIEKEKIIVLYLEF